MFGLEESHGYIAGNYIRDKDTAIAALWLAELAAELKKESKTLIDYLDETYSNFGYFRNYLTEIRLPGAQGMTKIQKIQSRPRKNKPDNQQIANALSLTITVMKQFNLTAWDVVGHHEIAKLKFDPGDYYMANLRFLLGIAAIHGKAPYELAFSRLSGPHKEIAYFETLYDYLKLRRCRSRLWFWENYLGYEDFMVSFSRRNLLRDRNCQYYGKK